jgi:hypothetical protein
MEYKLVVEFLNVENWSLQARVIVGYMYPNVDIEAGFYLLSKK